MFIRKKFLISLLITFSLVGGMAGLNASSPQVSAKTRYFVRYLNGKYNLFHNVPGRRKSYLMHYGRNYKNQKVYTGGTYWHNHKHYTRVVRNRRFFGFMNIAGGSRRKPRMRYHRRYVQHFARRHPRQNYASNYIEHSDDSDTPSYKYNVELGHTWFRSNDYHQYKLAKKDRSLIQQGLYTYDAKHNTMDPTQKLTAEEYYRSYKASINALKQAGHIHNQNQANLQQDHKNKVRRSAKHISKLPDFNTINEQSQKQTIQDINQDREENGKQPLTEDPRLDNIASHMAQWSASHQAKNGGPTHVNQNGQYEDSIIAKQLGYTNIAPYLCENLDEVGLYPENAYYDNNLIVNDRNGIQAANDMNNCMMNHDQSSNNGHRNNILGLIPNTNIPITRMGAGTYTEETPYGPEVHLAEEFTYPDAVLDSSQLTNSDN